MSERITRGRTLVVVALIAALIALVLSSTDGQPWTAIRGGFALLALVWGIYGLVLIGRGMRERTN